MHSLIEKDIDRNPRKALNLGVIIALALAFGLFISITMESALTYEIEKVRESIGSDIKIEAEREFDMTLNSSRLFELNLLSNIDAVVTGYSMYSTAGYEDFPPLLTAIDFDSYQKIVKPDNDFFVGSDSRIIDGLSENGTALISEDYAQRKSIIINDQIPFTLSYQIEPNGSLKKTQIFLKIIGVVRGLYPNSGLPGLESQIYTNRSTIYFLTDQQMIDCQSYVQITTFIDVTDNENQEAVAANAKNIFDKAGFSTRSMIVILSVEIQKVMRSPEYGSLEYFFNAEYVISILTMSIGVAIIIFITINDRKQELACIMARGLSNSQMRKLLIGESISLMSFGVIIGVAVGVSTSFMFNSLLAELSNQMNRDLIFTYTSLILIVIAIFSLSLALILATVKSGKLKLTEILRIRGG